MKYESLVKDILKGVGGSSNIQSVIHCMTRLRFQLKDKTKVNEEFLKNVDGVLTSMESAGEYHVVIGNHVADVYAQLVQIAGIKTQEVEETKEKKGILNQFVDALSGIMFPVLGLLAATGMMKGLLALASSLSWLDKTGGTYQLLYAVGDCLMYFFPVFLGYTAAKKFKMNELTGMAIGACMVYPAIAAVTQGEPLYTLFAGTPFESPIYMTFLGIPVILMEYTSTIIPIIIAAYVGSKIEKGFKKIIPDVVKRFLVPFFTLAIIVPLTYIVIGPAATWISDGLGFVTTSLYSFSPVLMAAIIGGFWLVFVMFGVHSGIIPLALNNVFTKGVDTILPATVSSNFALLGSLAAVMLKTKDKKLSTLTIPAMISALFGVTEPGLYGVALPKKKPLIISCISTAIASSIGALLGIKMFRLGGMGIFAFGNYIHPETGVGNEVYLFFIMISIAAVLSFILTFIFYKEENVEIENKIELSKKKDIQIEAPVKGQIISLEQVKDEVFAGGTMGKGIAVIPSEGKVYAPANGVVSAVFPTGHAYGITTDEGVEILVHIGIDTVRLNGKGFKKLVEVGQKVQKGEPIAEFDLNSLKKEKIDTTTIVVISNTKEYVDVIPTAKKETELNTSILTVMM